ncbi:hypothetical protein [Prosthecobacter sp.]|uniref:hypothetical protein n=1 Tax=Prosthecobacter sp. TaxID=1965333 RepID=UPI002488A7BB|nr:hypothetical protein [Prosthecobacter sp.]MDI1311841.1 hypothetical protein [Prosthecobacter sp.]
MTFKFKHWGLWISTAVIVLFAVTAARCARPTIKRNDVPMSRDEALKQGIRFPLPSTAHNIQIAQYSFGFAYELLVRFEAPVSVCEQHVAEVLKWDEKNRHDKGMPKQDELSTEKVDHVGYIENSTLKPTPWFALGTLKRGLHVGKPGCSVPEIWIDQEKGIFYFRETD